MTEKRFIADNEYVMQNGQVYVVCGGEHSADVVATALNELISENEQLKEEIARQKYTKHIMRENIKSYERAIKHLRKSYKKFDEMRLDRIRFLEKKLKKNGLSIYVNDCGDFE